MDENIKYVLDIFKKTVTEKNTELFFINKFLKNYEKYMSLNDLLFLKKICLKKYILLKNSYNPNLDIISHLKINFPFQSLIFINGMYHSSKNIDEFLKIDFFDKNINNVHPSLFKFNSDNKFYSINFFTIINDIFSKSGVYIHIPPKKVLTKPLFLLNFYTKIKNKFIVCTRNHISFGKFSSGKILEYNFYDSKDIIINNHTSISLNSYSNLDYSSINYCKFNNILMNNLNINQFSNSNFYSNLLYFGKYYGRFIIKNFSLGFGCYNDTRIIKLLKLNTIDYSDFYSNNSNKSHINCLFRCLIDDFAKCIFKGTININENINGVNGNLRCDSIVLSDKSKVLFFPKLDIRSSDVICTHGATIGFINNDIFLYMMSRGLSKNESLIIIIRSFIFYYINKKSKFFDIIEDFVIKFFFV